MPRRAARWEQQAARRAGDREGYPRSFCARSERRRPGGPESKRGACRAESTGGGGAGEARSAGIGGVRSVIELSSQP